jgi:hypothetical protein
MVMASIRIPARDTGDCIMYQCTRPAHNRGWCRPCYRSLDISELVPYVRPTGTCSTEGCERRARHSDLCPECYHLARDAYAQERAERQARLDAEEELRITRKAQVSGTM